MRKRLLTVAAAGALAIAVACSPAANKGDNGTDTENGESGKNGGAKTVVTFRLWDEQVKKAYDQSFAEFEKTHEDIDVQVQLVPWNEYWTQLPKDIGSGNMADIFWTNTSNFGVYADNGSLIDIGKHLGSDQANWKKSVVDLYTRNDKVWGVPQLWDSIALYYNKSLVDKAGVDPATLKWNPSGQGDTFLPAAKKLTLTSGGTTSQYGFNASLDPQGVYWNFVGSNGGVWQQGDQFAFADDPRSVQAIQYVVDLINEHKVAPPASDTNNNGDKTRDLFLQGKLALFQSGPYNLKTIHEGAKFEWGVAPMLEGPVGRVGVVHGVAAVGYAKTDHLEETVEVLKWLGSAAGQKPIADGGYAFPGVTSVESSYVAYWKRQGVDVAPFLEAAAGTTFPAPVGPKVNAGATAMDSTLKEIFLGRKPVKQGLAEAQKQGNEAMAE